MGRWLDKFRLRLRSLLRGGAVDRELAKELRAHLDEEIAALAASGMTKDDARRTAMRTFGSVTAIEEQCRETRRVSRLENLLRDVRYAVRVLFRQPGLVAAAGASIAIGTGANLTIFALANGLLLATPSADRPDRLVMIRTNNGSHVSFQAWQGLDASGAIAGVAGYQFEQSVNWRQGDASTTIVPLLVTANFFDVVRMPIERGAAFTTAQADAARDPHLVVVSHRFWESRLQGDPDVIGRVLTINGMPYTVTGVLADGTRSIAGFGLAPELYLPLSPSLLPALGRPHAAAAQLVGRLRDDQTLAAGRAAIAAVAARLGEAQNDDELKTIREFAPVGSLAQVEEFKELGLFFVFLFVVSALVLAIACANVAGLLLARGLARRRETALRIALGASRGRLIQQLLAESLIVTVIGAMAGAALTAVAFAVLTRVPLPLPLPVEVHLSVDWRMAALAIGLVLFATCVTGLAPALQATRPALLPAIKIDDRQFGARRLTVRSVLVVGQVAVSVLLLVAALLFVRSRLQASSVDPGFDVDRLLVAQLSFVEGHQGTPARLAVEDVVGRMRAVPGVSAAAFAQGVPLTLFSGSRIGTRVRISGRDEPMRVDYDGNSVGPGYFGAMGIRLVRGRDFSAADRTGAAPVVIVNEEFARRYLADGDPIGRTIVKTDSRQPTAEIVGVVSNGKYRSLSEAQDAAIYEPLLMDAAPDRLVHLVVRAAGGPEAVVAGVRQAVLSSDGSTAVTVTPMRDALAFATFPSRIGSILLSAFGACGTLLAMVGLFGVLSFAVSRRTAEIAIRMTLGASRRAVLGLVIEDAGRLVGAGVVVGLLLAWLVSAPLAAFLVAGVSPSDPWSFAGAAALLGFAALAAIWAPAWRAMAIAPSRALKLD